jgi:hypothetical protein
MPRVRPSQDLTLAAYLARINACTNSVKMRALAVVRPAGKTAQRSICGNVQPRSTILTVPSLISGANIHSEAIAIPALASTAARTPSAALTRRRPFSVTAMFALSRWRVQSSPPARGAFARAPVAIQHLPNSDGSSISAYSDIGNPFAPAEFDLKKPGRVSGEPLSSLCTVPLMCSQRY